jgi:uroporphyrinogen-III synthase
VPGVATQRLPPASPAAAALATALDALPSYAAVAFTSRAGVAAVLDRVGGARLAAAGPSLWALGADAGALTDAGVPPASVLAPREPSTRGLAAALVAALPRGARVLCPVPSVGGGLAEPPVVPRFLAALAEGGLDPVRVDAYTTLPGTAAGGAALEAAALADGAVDAVLFSSTAEAAGLALALGGDHAVTDAVSRHGVVLAAHGPYTAAGVAAVLGVGVDAFVVSRDFSSFHGVVAALEEAFEGQGV